MFMSSGPAVRSLLLTVLSSVLIVVSGCTDVLTYSNQSYEAGMARYNNRMYSDAAGAFRDAVRQDPRHYHAQFYLGVCYDELGQQQQAFNQYKTALEVMANTMEGKYDRPFRLLVLDAYAAAVVRGDKGDVELNAIARRTEGSQKSEDWFLLAKVNRLRGDADSALTAYRKAAQWDGRL